MRLIRPLLIRPLSERVRSPGMVARIALVLFCALLLELLGNVALQRWSEREFVTDADTRRIAAQLVAADHIATATQPQFRAPRVARLGQPGLELNWVPRTVITDSSGLPVLAEMKTRLLNAAPRLADRPLRLSILPSEAPGRRDLFGAMALADGSFLTFRVSPYLAAPPGLLFTAAANLLLLGAVLLIALMMIRALVRPLSDLANAADATQLGQLAPLPVEGPNEVRRVASAFAAMQARLFKTMQDHTQSLVAVSHDLRTPIQRLRLRAALLDDAEMRANITADLIEMERFIAATLEYIRDDKQEAARLVDVAAILNTAVDNAADAGAAITFRGVDALPVQTQPIALRRILGNLIGNAVRHATSIEVTLSQTPDHFIITVEDDGPGIPAALRAEAMLPFRRLQNPDARTGTGAGLGLAICVKAATAMGGELSLGDSPLGGLQARLALPAR